MLGWDYEAAVLLLFTKLEFVIKIFCFTKQRGNFKISAENSLRNVFNRQISTHIWTVHPPVFLAMIHSMK